MSEIIRLILIPLGVTLLGTIIYEVFRNIKKDYKISYVVKSIRKYREKESKDVRIQLSYKNEKVDDSLVVLTLRLINEGKKDISFKQIFEDKIGIILKDARIIDVLVDKQSDKVAAKVDHVQESNSQSGNAEWFLSWGILKKKEIVDLRIVAVYNDVENMVTTGSIEKDLEFHFRGNNINKIERNRPKYGLMALIILALLGAFMCLIPLDIPQKYDVVVDNVQYRDVTISYNAYSCMYSITGKNVSIKTTHIDKINLSSKQPNVFKFMIIFFAAVVIYFLVCFILYRIIRKSKKKMIRLRKILSFYSSPFSFMLYDSEEGKGSD